jgi:hypothetical protein
MGPFWDFYGTFLGPFWDLLGTFLVTIIYTKMPIIDFSKTCIYIIKCKIPDKNYEYIGTTTSFKKRKYYHKKNAENNVDSQLYNCINECGGWENWEMTILERVNCSSKAECVQKEKEWIEKKKKCIHPQFLLNSPQDLLNFPPISLNSPPILLNSENLGTNINNELICKFCKKTYTRKDNLKRHCLKCKVKKQNTDIIKTELEQCKKIIAEQQCQLAQRQPENKKFSVKNSNNTNNIINTTNNITYRVELGNENLQSRLTEKEKKRILEKMHSSLIEYIKLVHFSEKYPDCMNFFCTNLRSNHAHVYSEPQKQFITKYASDFFNTVVDTRLDEIITMFDEHKDKLENVKIERLNKFFESMESTDECKSKRYMETVANVKMLAYNNKHKFEGQSQEPSGPFTTTASTTTASTTTASTTTAAATIHSNHS